MQNTHRYNEKTAPIERIDFTILGNKETLNMSSLGKDTPGLLICEFYDNSEPKKGGLIDQRMGVTSNESECDTCGLGINSCPGHFGHITLSEPIYHMDYYEYVISILRCICIKCSRLLVYKNESQIMEILKAKKGKNRLNEIKNIVKNITYCQKTNYGCGAPVPKIYSEKKKSTIEINIVAEYALNNLTDELAEKKSVKDILSPQLVYNILKNISDSDSLILGIDPTKSRIEDMILLNLPVPPNPVRPSVNKDSLSSIPREDHLTIKLADILKANQRLAKHKESNNENQIKYFQDHVSYLQYHVATYYDNESLKLPQSEQKGVVTKSLASRLKGKEGRIRNNLMGKRTDFSGRTVITPDPTLSVNELGVPIGIAKNITFPEIVTPENIDKLSKLVRNGRDHYPGANYVIQVSSDESDGKLPIDLRFRKEKIDLKYGDIVERHTIDGDMFLLNRQPTLHKLSMMGHKCKVINNPNYCTFRINPNVTTPYNADFDGDEMNVFCPQSIEAQLELEEIADLKFQIITPKSSTPIIAMKQDQLLGTWNLTKEYYKINWRTVMNLLSSLELNTFDNIPKKDFTGKEVFSKLIPNRINYIKGTHSDPEILIKNGILEKGIVGELLIGVEKKNSLVQLIWDEYGALETKIFLDNTTKLSNSFNMYHGMTVGLGDLFVPEQIHEKIDLLVSTKELEIEHEITELENNIEMIDEKLFEISVNSKLSIILDESSKLIISNTPKTNMFITMSESGARGKAINFIQMAGCVGQQDFHGGRMKKNYNERSLPYYFKNDDRAESRGFISKSYTQGLNLPNFIFHHVTSREGLIDTAVRSVAPDTKIMVLENNIIKIVEIGPWIDSKIDLINKIEPELIEHDVNNFELLKIRDVKIPTVDDYGYVTWGDISAITRHDPGLQLFEIITNSGRRVVVPESKSLLIWNDKNKRFEPKLTPKVILGDKVPITMNLPSLLVNNKFITKEYLIKKEYLELSSSLKQIIDSFITSEFELNKQSGYFIGLYLACGSIDYEDNYIQINKDKLSELTFLNNYLKFMNIRYNENQKLSDSGSETTYIKLYSEKMCAFIKIFFDLENLKIPEFVFTAPEEFITELLNSYININSIIYDDRLLISSISEDFIDGLNILFTRINIFPIKNYDEINNKYETIINHQWINELKLKIGNLLNDNKNKKINLINQKISNDLNTINDVVIDEIKEINLIKNPIYSKLYDLTIPSTNNFIIFNGLGCYDTSESGYVQRKLIKATEDLMVNYDGTVRNASGKILQFQYGDSGADTIKQFGYNFNIMEMGNTEIETKYGMTKDELSKVKDWKDSDNKNFVKLIIKMRDNLRRTQIKSSLNYLTMNTNYMLSVNLHRIIDNFRNFENTKSDTCNEPKFIMDLIDDILEPYNTRLYCMTIDEMKNKKSIKYCDEQIAKTTFRYALTDILAPKKCIFQYKFSKEKLINIKEEIIKSFNKSIVEPGEMVGIIAAQSFGEPVTQLMLRTFHTSGIKGKGGTDIGVDRIKEILSLSKNPKIPKMEIFLDKEHRTNKDFANKIASYIKFTTIKDLRTKIEILYDPDPNEKDSIMNKDNIGVPFHTYQSNKNSCSNSIDGLPWLVRIEFNREKLLNKEVTLLDIKSQFCFSWEKRNNEIKNIRREKKELMNKITQLAILSNNDNDNIPIIHIRFDVNNTNQATLIDFIDLFVDEFKLKGIPGINDIASDEKAVEERVISFDNADSTIEKNSEYIIYTIGINMESIKNIVGIDLNRTYCNDIIMIYENFGIEAARNFIITQNINVLTTNGSGTNYQHIQIFGDLMAHVGTLTSIDRHGLNKLDTDPLSRASFEKTVDQLITAAVFNEVDYMKSVSSRIMAGLCIKSGTGLCNLILDKDLLENSEYTTDISHLYNRTYKDITSSLQTQEIDDEIFIPEM